MDSNWASDHLQTIRTLMERSALYRRALAPVMLTAGAIGVAAGVVPSFVDLRTNRVFAIYWMGVGVVALAAVFLLVRRQALRAREQFWSPPTRRVTEAMVPPFIAGAMVAMFLIVFDDKIVPVAWIAVGAWAVLYGCALSAAGFFTPRGIGLFGRILVLLGCGLSFGWFLAPGDANHSAHYAMAGIFGLLHLVYGTYLYFSERKRRA
jgi:hypothetical protein